MVQRFEDPVWLGSLLWLQFNPWPGNFHMLWAWPNFFFFFFAFLGLCLWYMEVPRLGFKSELKMPAYAKTTAVWDLSMSVIYTIAHGNTGFLTH